jgi:hypothetical protein
MRPFVFLIFLFILPLTAIAQIKAPDGLVRVTYQQVENGEIGKGYHELELSCYAGDCTLMTVTFNQCWRLTDPSGYSFIKVETESTKGGNLKIKSVTKDTLILEQQILGGSVVYRFSYKLTQQGTLGPDSLTDFSGGATKNSDILGQVLNWQLIPLRTKNGTRFETVKLDCSIRVEALPGK